MNNNIIEVLLKNGFKQYKHKSGFVAWSITNLCEYSDEWEHCAVIPQI